jgi:hypothetical protein
MYIYIRPSQDKSLQETSLMLSRTRQMKEEEKKQQKKPQKKEEQEKKAQRKEEYNHKNDTYHETEHQETGNHRIGSSHHSTVIRLGQESACSYRTYRRAASHP